MTDTPLTLYGIKNCDTVRKARKWLDARDLAYGYHDFRGDGIDENTLRRWLSAVGPDTLVNKRSTTWKNLDASERAQADSDQLPSLLARHPTLIKRPVLERGEQVIVGFNEHLYSDMTS